MYHSRIICEAAMV